MSLPALPVDFSRHNAGDQALDPGPSHFPQAWDTPQDMYQQPWSHYQSPSPDRGRSQSYPQLQYQQQCNVHYQNAHDSTANALPSEAPRHHSLPLPPPSQSFTVQESQPFPRDEAILSPLPIDQLPHTFPYQDLITPPTPNFPNSTLPSPATTIYFTPFSTLGELEAFSPPNHFPSLQVSPAVSTRSISHSPYGSPYAPLPSPIASNTTISTSYPSPYPYTPNHLPTNLYSPLVASPSSFHSMSLSNTPAMGPAPCLPSVHYPAFLNDESSMSPKKPSAPVPPSRRAVPQKLALVSTRDASQGETFKVGSKPGVRVRDVLHNKVVIDGHNERVLESTGARQFRLVIDWPGYQSSGTYIQVQNKGKFITRGELAKVVCERIEVYMRKAKKKAGPPEPGDEEYALAHGRRHRGITIDKLWLLRILPKTANIWMADLEVQM